MNDECPICMSKINFHSKKILDCKHSFHKECIDEWLKTKNTCPCCRHIVDELFMEEDEEEYIYPEIQCKCLYCYQLFSSYRERLFCSYECHIFYNDHFKRR